jgi:hypothetical protein
MTLSCVCRKFHYSLDHYFAIHGDYLDKVPEHRTRAPILPNGKVYDSRKRKDNEPVPLITWKWVCRYCGNFNTSDEPKTHKSNCGFIKYLAFRETEPFKKGVVSVVAKSEEPKKPSKKPKPEEPTKYELTEQDKKKIGNYRNELLNILIKYEFDFEDEPDINAIITKFKQDNNDKPVGYFWQQLKQAEVDVGRDTIIGWSMWRKYAYYCDIWEQTEAGGSTVFQPERKRRMIEWYLLSKLSFPYLEKLEGLKDKNDKPRLDPSKKYLLSELLLLIPKRKKPKPKPENAPLQNQIDRFIKEYNERLVKYIDLDVPPYFPENEVDKVGKDNNYWKDDGWKDFLENSKDTQNDQGVFTDLQKRINALKTVFAKVVLERLIEKRQKHQLENFITNYNQEPEKTVYNSEPYKTQIENVFNEVDVDPLSDISSLFALPNYYDELFSNQERNDAEEWQFTSLTLEQWNKLDLESDLRKGLFELRNFPNLKKLKIRVDRPYLGAPAIKKIDISGTADNLEELDLSQMENLEEVIIGKKPNLKKLDVRWTSLKKLNLTKTALSPKDYDTSNFPIRADGDGTQGSIINPFENFTGDSDLITLLRTNIQFNIPWIRYDKDWSVIAMEFKNSPNYIDEWYKYKFNYESAKGWMDTWGTNPDRIKKAGFCAWLRNVKRKNAEWLTNHGKLAELELEYIAWLEKQK